MNRDRIHRIFSKTSIPDVFPQVYLAGSYSHDTQSGIKANVYSAIRCAKLLSESYSVLPIIPHTMGPHHGMDWETAMVRCRELIHGMDIERDAVVMLPGWKNSKGATEEWALAKSRGLMVVEISELI